MVGLLGIHGKAGSGKSTAAQVLIDGGFKRVKFAGPLKNMLRAIGLTDRHIEGDLKETPCDMLLGQTPRHAMQTLGTEWGRGCIGGEFWTNLARREIVMAMAQGFSVVVDDVRFQNEADLIREWGGMVLHIDRGESIAPGHVSENRLDCDLTYLNYGTIGELRGYMRYVFLEDSGNDL